MLDKILKKMNLVKKYQVRNLGSMVSGEVSFTRQTSEINRFSSQQDNYEIQLIE